VAWYFWFYGPVAVQPRGCFIEPRRAGLFCVAGGIWLIVLLWRGTFGFTAPWLYGPVAALFILVYFPINQIFINSRGSRISNSKQAGIGGEVPFFFC
jgi:uncharacterized membrane protein SirB2